MKSTLVLSILLGVLSACQNRLPVETAPPPDDLFASLRRTEERVWSLGARAVLFRKDGAGGSGRGAVGGTGRVVPNIDLKPVCGIPVSLDVYLPTGAPPAAGWHTVVLLHGGGWVGGSRDTMVPLVPRFLNPTRGGPWLVANLSYPTNVSMGRIFHGMACAVAWLRSQSHTGLINPERLSAFGGSAGGHLAALLAALGPGGGSSRVDAGVSFAGPADLGVLWHLVPGLRPALEKVLGGNPAKSPRYRTFSPTTYLPLGKASPILWLSGDRDPIVPLAAAGPLAARFGGGRVESRVFSGGHESRSEDLDYAINEFLAEVSPE